MLGTGSVEGISTTTLNHDPNENGKDGCKAPKGRRVEGRKRNENENETTQYKRTSGPGATETQWVVNLGAMNLR